MVYGDSPIIDLGLVRNVKVSRFISGDTRDFSQAPTQEIMEIFQLITNSSTPSVEFDDEAIWTASDHGEFVMGSRSSSNVHDTSWIDLVWFKGKINKHFALAWLAFSNGLKTKMLLAARNVNVGLHCVLCNENSEDNFHLFSSYDFTCNIRVRLSQRFSTGTFSPAHGTSSLESSVRQFLLFCKPATQTL